MYRHKTTCSLAATAFLVTVITAAIYHGDSNRRFAPGKETVPVASPEQAYDVWRQKQVKGRTLLLFDRYPHMRGRFNYQGEPQLQPSNLVEFSIFKNVVRKIYFIVPDAAWEDFLHEQTTKQIKPVPGLARGISLYNLNGLPMIATTPTSLPHLSEQVLVYINAGVFAARQAQDLLARKAIDSDIVVIYQGTHQ